MGDLRLRRHREDGPGELDVHSPVDAATESDCRPLRRRRLLPALAIPVADPQAEPQPLIEADMVDVTPGVVDNTDNFAGPGCIDDALRSLRLESPPRPGSRARVRDVRMMESPLDAIPEEDFIAQGLLQPLGLSPDDGRWAINDVAAPYRLD